MEPSGKIGHITGWAALSPFGVGRQAFADGYLSGRTGRRPDLADASGPAERGYRLAGFDPAELLGTKGTRSLDRLTLMVTATVDLVLAEHAGTLGERRQSVGLVLGTSTGSVASIVEFTKDTFTQSRPYHVNPALFPNTVMNGAAGHAAIWHQLHGLNSTVAAGLVTGLATLRYATRMLRSGHADTLVVGCVEELSTPVVQAVARIRQVAAPAGAPTALLPGDTPLGEGCVMFLVDTGATAAEQRRRPLADLVDFESAVALPGDPPELRVESLTGVIRSLLARNRVSPADLWRVSPARSGTPELDRAEAAALAEVFCPAPLPEQVTVASQIGNSYSALGAFQVAAVLAAAQREPAGRPARPVLVTGLGLDGSVAAALVSV
jgi:3-oxoacyl-[acyl-carrier-protein] synthase II